jgi:mycothiol synthase
MVEIREIGEDELARFAAVRNAIWPHDPLSVEDFVDWRNQAKAMVWLIAADADVVVGSGLGIHGWHSPPGVGHLDVHVLEDARRRGTGSALLNRLARRLGERGCEEATASVFAEDAPSLAWALRRGFSEVGRNSIMALDLVAAAAPEPDPPAGVEIVSWADRPDVIRGVYEVYREAEPDIPGEEDAELPQFEEWLANDMQGAGDRPDATFVAVADGDVVGYAKLSISRGGGDVAWHDITGVKRAWRGRGVAGALKRTQIAWAKASG